MFERVRPTTRAAQVALVLVAFALLAGCGSSRKTAATSEQNLVSIGAGLSGPAGLHATVYAMGLKLMSAFAFDARGRLWVTTSGSSRHATDGLYLVSRADARPTRIARFRGPLGLVWIGGKLYVSSLGRVESLAGLTGTHFASRTTILVGPKGGGENNNLVESPAGKLVLGVSASCDHCVPASKWSGAIVEFDTSGANLHLFARRVRAPFGLAFYPGTSNLLATLNQRDDLGAKTPGDWLALVRQRRHFWLPAVLRDRVSSVRRCPRTAGGARQARCGRWARTRAERARLGARPGRSRLRMGARPGRARAARSRRTTRSRQAGSVPHRPDESAPAGGCSRSRTPRRRLDDREDLPNHALVQVTFRRSSVEGTK